MLSLLAKSGVIDLDSVDSDELEAILDSDSSIDDILDDVKVEPKADATTCPSSLPPSPLEDPEAPDSSDSVRRSVRPRRSSSRFGDFVDPDAVKLDEIVRQISPVGKRPKLSTDKPEFPINQRSRTNGIRTLRPKVRVDDPLPTSDSEEPFVVGFSSGSDDAVDLARHCLEPELVLAYALRYGPPNPIPPNTFGVRLAVGPDEYATVEAVEYLRSLGYPNIEMDESNAHTEEMIAQCDDLNKRIQSIPKKSEPPSVVKTSPKSFDRTMKQPPHVRTLAWDDTGDSELSRDGLLAQQRDSLSLTSINCSSRSSSNSDVEVEVIENLRMSDSPEPTPRVKPAQPRKHKKPQRSPAPGRVVDDRSRHNDMERMRRVVLREEFLSLNHIIAPILGIQIGVQKAVKVQILRSAAEVVRRLQDAYKRLTLVHDELVLKRERLTKHLTALQEVARQRSSGAQPVVVETTDVKPVVVKTKRKSKKQ